MQMTRLIRSNMEDSTSTYLISVSTRLTDSGANYHYSDYETQTTDNLLHNKTIISTKRPDTERPK